MSTRDLLALISGAGKTVEQVAQALQVDARTIVNIAKGYQPMPKAMIADFAGFLGVDVSEVEYACPAIAADFLDLFTLKNPQNLPFDPTKIYQPGGVLFSTLQAGMLKTMQGGITLSGDVSGPSDSNTVDKWKNVALDIATMVSPPNAGIPIFDSLAASWKAHTISGDISMDKSGAVTVNAVTGFHGTAGQMLITNGTPVAVWSSAILIDASAYTGVTTGKFDATGAVIGKTVSSNYGLRIAPLIGQETTFAGIWVGPNALTPGPANYIMAVATNAFLFNGAVDIATDGGFNDVAIASGHSITFNNVASSTASIGTNGAAASLLLKADAAKTVQGLHASTNALQTDFYDPAGTVQANLIVNNVAGVVELFTPNNYQMVFETAAGSGLNWSNAAMVFNVASGSYFWELNGTPYLTFTPGSPSIFQCVEGTGILYNIEARTSDAATNNLTIQGQYAFAGATGTNRTPGNIVFDIGAPTNGSNVEANFRWTRNGTGIAQIGSFLGSTQSLLWLGSGAAPTLANYVFDADGLSFTNLNAPTGSVLEFTQGGSVFLQYFPAAGNLTHFGNFDATSPVTIDWSTAIAPIINSGTSATSLTVGTNKNAATLTLQAGAGVSCISCTAPGSTAGTGTSTITGGLIGTWRDSSVSFTIDTNTTDFQIHVTATQTITMPAPVTGRWWPILIDTTGGSAITLTLARHASEKINNVAASWVYTFPANGLWRYMLTTDGTNFFFV